MYPKFEHYNARPLLIAAVVRAIKSSVDLLAGVNGALTPDQKDLVKAVLKVEASSNLQAANALLIELAE